MADLIEMESMGGVVARVSGDDVEIVICGFDAQPGHVVWGLPKGTPEDGETHEQTALREVSEETGLRVSIDAVYRQHRLLLRAIRRRRGMPQGGAFLSDERDRRRTCRCMTMNSTMCAGFPHRTP